MDTELAPHMQAAVRVPPGLAPMPVDYSSGTGVFKDRLELRYFCDVRCCG